jgi:peptidoglycan/LPS O-acetylase OafA/YrhL
MPNKIASKRYAELDVFRGLAILSVVLFHYTTKYNHQYGHVEMPFAFPHGELGVQLFFMISGFVIYMSIENIKKGSNFIINRFSRLYPAYWVSIGITFGMVSIFTLPGRQVSLYDAIINITMAQDWIGGVKEVDGVYWTLSRFLSFYFIVFLLHKLKLKPKIVLFCVIWLFLIYFAKMAEDLGLMIPFVIKLTFLLDEGSFFIIGIMFYLSKKYVHNLSFYIVILCCLFNIWYVNGPQLFFAALLFSFLFFLTGNGYLKFITIKPLTWLGGISYSLYLVHQNIGYIIINKLKNLDLNFLFLIIIPMAISFAIAAAITYLIERPCLNILRSKMLTSRRMQEDAAQAPRR